MSIVRKPAPDKSATWAKWDDTAGRWVIGNKEVPPSLLFDRSIFYFWLGADAERLHEVRYA